MFIENLTKQKLKHSPAYADILKVQAQKETGPSSHAKQDSLYQGDKSIGGRSLQAG
jgi:hypothetical protein